MTRDGKPLARRAPPAFKPNGPTNPGSNSYGKTDAAGLFELKVVTTDAPGAVVGIHRVYVTPPSKAPDPHDDTVKINIRPTQFDFVVPPEGTWSADFDLPPKKK